MHHVLFDICLVLILPSGIEECNGRLAALAYVDEQWIPGG
jgi:hypothetical protein